ncbi:hypothetical protein CKAH01_02654 [Colletotrichum kahawae]|uniref:Uncharacterized protein n=1 Tax=Colletotrichum kahawae TaxID=34407 RepID=A0AAD9XY15_COLKA|nr:hypothetical protein CKAH01_02654 [Colletotrichum kahawae]
MRRTPFIFLAAAAAGISAVQGTCFVPNGTDRQALANIGNNRYEPCEGNGHSMCCNVVSGDKCQADGLCWNEGGRLTWRESCTDPTWQSPKCVKLCISDDYQTEGVGATGTDIVVTKCADGSYCCGNNKNATDCCNAGQGVKIVDGQVVTTSSATASGSTTTSTSSSIPTSSSSSAGADSPAPSNNQASVIGGAVGGGFGAVILALAAWFFWYKRRKRNTGAGGDTAEVTQNYLAVSQEAKYPTVVEAPNYYPPVEMPGEGHPVELGSESVRPPSRR